MDEVTPFNMDEVTPFNDCSICLEEIVESSACKITCGHYLCKPCIDALLDSGNISCPLCRQKITYFEHNNDKYRVAFQPFRGHLHTNILRAQGANIRQLHANIRQAQGANGMVSYFTNDPYAKYIMIPLYALLLVMLVLFIIAMVTSSHYCTDLKYDYEQLSDKYALCNNHPINESMNQ